MDYLERKPGGRWGKAASTPRNKKDPRYTTSLYSVRLTNAVRDWLKAHVPTMARSRWVEAAILFCIQLAKNPELLNAFEAFRAGAYWGLCKGVVLAREETDHNIDAEIARLWEALEQEIAQSSPRHWHAPMPAHMMSVIDRPLDEILGTTPTDGPPDAPEMNRGAGVREPVPPES